MRLTTSFRIDDFGLSTFIATGGFNGNDGLLKRADQRDNKRHVISGEYTVTRRGK